MKSRKLRKRIVSLLLTFAMLLSLVPVSALAAEPEDERPASAEFKVMGLYSLRNNGRRVSYFSYETRDNTFLTNANITYPQSWFKLVHVIEKSQPITLELYEMNEDPQYMTPKTLSMPYSETDTADGFGKLQNEAFLGKRLGVLVGVPVQENVVPLNEGDDIYTAPKVGYSPIDDDTWWNIIYQTTRGEREPMLLQNFYSFGYEGNRLAGLDETNSAAETSAMMTPVSEELPAGNEDIAVTDETVVYPEAFESDELGMDAASGTASEELEEEQVGSIPTENVPLEDTQDTIVSPELPEDEGFVSGEDSDDAAAPSDGDAADEQVNDGSGESGNAVDGIQNDGKLENQTGEGLVDGAEDEENPQTALPEEEVSAQGENPDEDETSGSVQIEEESNPAEEPEQEEIEYLPESAVFPSQSSFFALGDDEADDNTIQNIVLWDGSYQTDTGEITRITKGGRYVIVMQPCTPRTAIYNSFLAFDVPDESESIDTFESINSWEDLMKIREELACSGDPVDLLNGSFTWNYRDFALYGKDDLEFTRYYESVYANDNFGLGNGWTSNFSYSLEFDGRSVIAHLPRGTTLYFPIDFDGSYGNCGNYSMTRRGGRYVMTDKSGNAYTFSDDGKIVSIAYLNGNTISFSYSGGQLQQVSNATGSFTFEYSGSNISKVTDSVGRSISLSYDGDLLVAVENPDGDSLRYTYDNKGYLSTIKNFIGEIYVENEYDGLGRVVHQYAADFGTFDFTYDFDARHNVCTGEDGYFNEIWFDEQGRITKAVDSSGGQTVTYNDLNQVTSRTDREGNTTEYEYDADGNISCTTYPDGTTEEFEYNENRMPTWVKDRNGNEYTYTYDAQCNMTSATDARGNTSRYAYDSAGNMISFTNALGNTTEYTYDGQGNCLSETDANGNTTRYTYDDQGRLASTIAPDGAETSYAYTEAGKLVKTTDAARHEQVYTVDGNGFNLTESDWIGNITAYTYDTQNHVTSVTDPLGHTTTYTYDESGNQITSTDANGNTTSYTYDTSGRMVSMTNAVGSTWTYAYDKNSQTVAITDPAGGVTRTSYNEVGRTDSTTDSNGNVTHYVYDGVGNNTKVTDALGKSTVNTYDENGNLISVKDRNGNTTRYVYDANNRLTETINALGGVSSSTYDGVGNLLTSTSAGGRTVSYGYDAKSQNTTVTNARGFVTSTEYDVLGRVVTTTYADGSKVSYTYDANGQILTSTDTLAGVTSYTYDNAGQMLTMTDPMGGVITYTYDPVGNVTSITDSMGFATAYTYTADNQQAAVTDAEGKITSYTYDSLGRVSSVTSPEGNATSYTYDANGNLLTTSDAEGGVVRYEYDALNRLVASTDANGNRQTYEYDGEGNQTKNTDPMGYATSSSYDALGQLVEETDRNGNVRKYAYDADGYLISSTDPLGNVTRYTYDENGNQLTQTTPLGLTTGNAYDSMDRVSATTDPMGHVVTFFYDAAGQLVGMTNKDGTEVSYTYDANGNNLTVTDEEGYVVTYTYDANNRMTSLKNARGYTTSYEYDKVGNLVKTINAMNGVSTVVYDKDGNLISETNTDGGTTTYTYDGLGRVLTMTDPNGAVTRTEYDANGNIVKLTQADGHAITYTYNARNELVSYVDAAGYTHSFTYDGNGNKTSETDGNGNTTYYTYDALDRLVGKKDAEGNPSSKTYDADGRLIKTVNEEGAETNYIYDDCGRVIKMTDALDNATTYTYDEMDRVLTITDARGGVTAYTYTDRGDVATETNAEGYTISYEYDGNHNMVKKTTVDGDTTYEYDPLDRLVKTTTPDGKSEILEYNGEGQIVSSTDKGGHKTSYVLDSNGNVVETIDALGNSALFEYDSMGNLVKTSLHRVDTQDGVDEWEITLYEYDGRGLTTKQVDALGNVTTYTYDGNGNLKTKTDADGYVTTYGYNGLDMVTSINYNGGKEVSYQYNKVGDLVKMVDWTGTTTFEVDLLNRITKTTDTKGNVVGYTYDATGNQTSVSYPDGTTATKTYDLLGQLKTVTETDGRTTTYTYDGMGRISKMEYPHGWVEDYHYDSIGQLLKVEDTDPTQKDMKQQKHVYEYDACGNMTYEYMRGNGTGEATVENTYTYDALHRVISVHENYGNDNRSYTYDSLGNLTYETAQGNKSVDYKLNNLNQITSSSDDGWKTSTTCTYDKRGNLIQELYTKNNKQSVTGAYTYDETNKMVKGVNDIGESSEYLYNGLGALVTNTWTIKKNAYGYHDVQLSAVIEGETVVDADSGKKAKKEKKTAEEVTASPELNKTSTVVKEFVVDYTTETHEPLMEHEVNGLDYRYVYGNDRLSVNITGVENGSSKLIEDGNQIRLYYHMDYLGTADYLTSPLTGKVESWTHYNEWGEITHNAVLKCGQRELDMVKRYATHDYDQVLGMYYAKARFYDAEHRRFVAMDPLKGRVDDPMTMIQYIYVLNSPLNYVDIDGKMPVGWLRMIKDAYILGFIPKDYVGSVVLIANIVALAAKTIDNIMNIVSLDVRDIYDMVTGVEDELKNGDVSRQSIYVSLHETAQVLSAKAIYNKYGASLGSLFQIFPELEDINFQLKEIDISYGSYAWEVKPVGTSESKWLKSLKKYIDGYDEDKSDSDYNTWFGYRIPGGDFSSVFARMATYNGKDVYITAHWIAPGKIEYFLQLKCENQYEEISVKDFATELIPVFKKAEAVNSATTIAVAFVAFLGTIATPVPGDEAAVSAALGNLLAAAGLA